MERFFKENLVGIIIVGAAGSLLATGIQAISLSLKSDLDELSLPKLLNSSIPLWSLIIYSFILLFGLILFIKFKEAQLHNLKYKVFENAEMKRECQNEALTYKAMYYKKVTSKIIKEIISILDKKDYCTEEEILLDLFETFDRGSISVTKDDVLLALSRLKEIEAISYFPSSNQYTLAANYTSKIKASLFKFF